MGKFVGDNRVEGRAVVYKEHPDVGVFIFQVGEGDVKGGSDGVGGRPVVPVCRRTAGGR